MSVEILKGIFKKRKKNSHKYDYGRLLIYAGSPGMYGAALLCARAALKTGCGLVYIHSDQKMDSFFNMAIPEAVFVCAENLDEILKKVDAAVIGPGLGLSDTSKNKILKIINSVPKVLIDADGLNNLLLKDISAASAGLVLTPHAGELSKLSGLKVNEHNRNEIAENISNKIDNVVVAKGKLTYIVYNSKKYECQRGGPELATAGSGDVLSGIIGSILAMGHDIFSSSVAGVYLHALCGENAKKLYGEYSCSASDLVSSIPEVILKNVN